jgi:hypothetical protein
MSKENSTPSTRSRIRRGLEMTAKGLVTASLIAYSPSTGEGNSGSSSTEVASVVITTTPKALVDNPGRFFTGETVVLNDVPGGDIYTAPNPLRRYKIGIKYPGGRKKLVTGELGDLLRSSADIHDYLPTIATRKNQEKLVVGEKGEGFRSIHGEIVKQASGKGSYLYITGVKDGPPLRGIA